MWLGTNNVYKVNDINFFTLQNANCYYSVKLVNCEKYHLAPTFKPLVSLWQYQIRTYEGNPTLTRETKLSAGVLFYKKLSTEMNLIIILTLAYTY